MRDFTKTIEEMKKLDSDISCLGHIMALLEWDQETYMPVKAAEERAAQCALISGIQYSRIVDSKWEELFSDLLPNPAKMEQLNEVDRIFVREVHRRWERAVRLSQQLVEEISRQRSLGQNTWAKARRENDFASFAPYMETMLGLLKEYSHTMEPNKEAYATLLDEYERDAEPEKIAQIFEKLGAGIKVLLKDLSQGKEPRNDFLQRSFPVSQQDQFGKHIQAYLGYDTTRGRNDLTTHPFCTTLGSHDVRVTTRYDENQILSGLFSNIHEAGHALYEQGISSELFGTLLATGTSLGIHESQSRFWENVIGRAEFFWIRWYKELTEAFPTQLSDISNSEFFRAVNKVSPSLIRVDADEITYNLHVIIRFSLERRLISGDLSVNELPEAWNRAYKDYLGISPPNDTMGCLQDVHWSGGLFGYFPTYVLGNLYSAQFTVAMEKELGPLSELILADRNNDILQWLRKNIHEHGCLLLPNELCVQVNGEDLNPDYFLQYLQKKYKYIYEL